MLEMGTGMAILKLSKIEAARRQIDSAIRMLFMNEDPVSIHTIAAAADRILRNIAETKGNIDAHVRFKDLIKPGMEKEFWFYMNRASNFLKHADKDPDSIYDDFNEESNDWILLIACYYYRDLGHTLTPEMHSLAYWMMLIHPNIIKVDHPMKAELIRISGSIDDMTRAKKLEVGSMFIEKLRRKHKGY